MFAGQLERLVEEHLAAVDLDVVRGLESVRDIAVADRAVDAPIAGAYADLEVSVAEEFGEALGVRFAFGELLSALSQASLEFSFVGLGGRQRQTLRDEEVAGVTVLYTDDIAGFSQLLDGFQQDDVHFRTSFSVIGMIASMRARLMVVASRR